MRLSLHNQAAQDLPPAIVEFKALLMITQMETFFGSPKAILVMFLPAEWWNTNKHLKKTELNEWSDIFRVFFFVAEWNWKNLHNLAVIAPSDNSTIQSTRPVIDMRKSEIYDAKATRLCCLGTCSAVTCLGEPTGRGKCLKATLVDCRAQACKRVASNCKDGSAWVEWTLKVATHEFLLRIADESLPASDQTPPSSNFEVYCLAKTKHFHYKRCC